MTFWGVVEAHLSWREITTVKLLQPLVGVILCTVNHVSIAIKILPTLLYLKIMNMSPNFNLMITY